MIFRLMDSRNFFPGFLTGFAGLTKFREFLLNFKNLGLFVCVLSLVSCATTRNERVRGPPNEFRGAWVYDPRKFEPDEVVRDLKEAGFNAVFVRLSSAGAAYYPSEVLPMASGTRQDYARAYAEAGKKYGIQVHAWHVCFMMHNAPKSSVNAAVKKGQVMRTTSGKAPRPTYNVPVRTPASEFNRNLEETLMVELVTKYPLDGVQFDYIRYFSSGVDYSATARARFEKTQGSSVKHWPSDVARGRLKESYHKWRTDLITSLVGRISRVIRMANPKAKISAAVWHSPEVGLKEYAQDWVEWVRAGYLDFVVPMNYTPDEERLAEWISCQQELVGGRAPIYAGLGSYMLNRPEQINRQIAICRNARLPGYVLYSYDELLKKRFLSEISD